MKKKNYLRSLTCFLVVFFLFASVVSRAYTTSDPESGPKHLTFSKATVPVKADTQLPFEEKEEEKEQEKTPDTNHYLFVIYREQEYLLPAALSVSTLTFHNTPRYCGNRPIYLAERAFLI